MLTINQVREDLKEIRYYYSLQKAFDAASDTLKPVALLDKVSKYNEAIKSAPAIFFIIYIELYVKNATQIALATVLGYTREYINEVNGKLIKYLQKTVF